MPRRRAFLSFFRAIKTRRKFVQKSIFFRGMSSQAVWEAIMGVVGDLKKLVQGEPEEEFLDVMLRELLGKIKVINSFSHLKSDDSKIASSAIPHI